MNTEINGSTNPHKYRDVLFNFCITFEQEWAKRNIRVWSPPADGDVITNLTQLQDDVSAVTDKVETLFNYAHTQPAHWPQNEDEWALSHLKSILHSILDPLRRISFIIDLMLNNDEIPKQEFLEGYRTILRYSRQIDLLVEKAFPLLKENKSYLDIDWQNEFKDL